MKFCFDQPNILHSYKRSSKYSVKIRFEKKSSKDNLTLFPLEIYHHILAEESVKSLKNHIFDHIENMRCLAISNLIFYWLILSIQVMRHRTTQKYTDKRPHFILFNVNSFCIEFQAKIQISSFFKLLFSSQLIYFTVLILEYIIFFNTSLCWLWRINSSDYLVDK